MPARSAVPAVTVVVPAYNREHTLAEAIDSLLAQTFGDFEILVIDDGSTDRTAEVAAGYRDPRVRLERNERNLGVCATRNRGIALARGALVANLDSDDRALPQRLERQVAWMRTHSDCALLGGWARRIDAGGHRRKKIYRRPIRDVDIRAELLFRNCFKNTTVIARRDVLARVGYREQFRVNEDVDLHVRIALEHPVANLPEVLSEYRKHDASLSRSERNETRAAEMAIAAWQLERLGIAATAAELELHHRLRDFKGEPFSGGELDRVEVWLLRLYDANRQRGKVPPRRFGRVVGERWWRAGRASSLPGSAALARTMRSPLGGRAVLAAAHRRADQLRGKAD